MAIFTKTSMLVSKLLLLNGTLLTYLRSLEEVAAILQRGPYRILCGPVGLQRAANWKQYSRSVILCLVVGSNARPYINPLAIILGSCLHIYSSPLTQTIPRRTLCIIAPIRCYSWTLRVNSSRWFVRVAGQYTRSCLSESRSWYS